MKSEIILCKATTADLRTYSGFKWRRWVPAETKQFAEEPKLCSEALYHCFEHPLVASFIKPLYCGPSYNRLWTINVPCGAEFVSDGTKRGYQSMSLLDEIHFPEVSIVQRTAYGILCALAVYTQPSFHEWASRWLANEDRSAYAAYAAARAARAAYAAAYAATYAAYAATYAAYAAIYAANAAANAARAAARAVQPDVTPLMISCAREALKYK